MDPDLQQTSGSRLPLEELQRNNVVKLNLPYSSMSADLISEYAAVNISTNLYVISQPWLYSLAWCSGVHSVTTNAPQLLRTLNSPLLLMVGLTVTSQLLCSSSPKVFMIISLKHVKGLMRYLTFSHFEYKWQRIGPALTSDVSQSSLLPRTRFPMVMWKYVLPLLQLEIFVKGCVIRMSYRK
ncbi:hypothetical protein XENOCAPTIV_002118, partial [Xenoophorus captivus]